MSSATEIAAALVKAIKAKQVEEAQRAFADVKAAALTPDARSFAALINLFALNRKNEEACDAYALGVSAHGAQALQSCNLNMNALVYACCREPAKLLGQAMGVWSTMAEVHAVPDTEPTNRLILANVAQSAFDGAFSVFLGAIEAKVPP